MGAVEGLRERANEKPLVSEEKLKEREDGRNGKKMSETKAGTSNQLYNYQKEEACTDRDKTFLIKRKRGKKKEEKKNASRNKNCKT